MRVMTPLNTWLSLEDGFQLNDSTACFADLLQAIPLTMALKRLHQDFSVSLLHLGASDIKPDEQAYFESAAGADGYSREVMLHLNQQAVVWARSVCLHQSVAWQDIMNCGVQPLGSRLYELPLQRTHFEYAYLTPEHPANPGDDLIVSRRSCFYLQDASLLLIESFLPTLHDYL